MGVSRHIMAADAPLEKPAYRLGAILVDEGIISEGQLVEGEKRRVAEGGFIGKALVELGYLTEHDLTSFLVKQFKIPHISLMDYEFNDEMLRSLPQDLCLKHSLLPIDKLGRILTVAMVDPLDAEALDAVRKKCPELRIKPILCSWRHFEQVVRKVYPNAATPQKAGEEAGALSADSLGLPAAASKTTKKDGAKTKAKKRSSSSRRRMAAGASAPLFSEILEQTAERIAQEDRPVPEELKSAASFIQAIEETVHESMRQAAETMTDRIQELIFASGDESPVLDEKQLLAAIRDALQKAMESAGGTILYQARSALEQLKTDGSALSSQHISEILRISIRQAIQDASLDIVKRLAKTMSEENPYG